MKNLSEPSHASGSYNDYNAYVNKNLLLQPKSKGSLDGLSFAVKDVFAIESYISSGGNPDWLKTHMPATRNAFCIDQLLLQGAKLQGTAITDELMYSLQGENYHYGTPINPKGPGRIPGGSSSGSAVIVAAGLSDFALGTDTGGSVRIPSSYCGIYGFRPTHGTVSIEGVIPLASSFDTVGWMSKDPKVLLEVGKVLLENDSTHDEQEFDHLFFAKEAWEVADLDTRESLVNHFSKYKPEHLKSEWMAITTDGLDEWTEIFRMIQGIEIWENHGQWISYTKPNFGPGIAERFAIAEKMDRNKKEEYVAKKISIAQRLDELLKGDHLLVIPTSPGMAPSLNTNSSAADIQRLAAMKLTCIAGLSGFPQVTIPFISEYGFPIGLSFIARKGQDLRLLKWVYQTFAKPLLPSIDR